MSHCSASHKLCDQQQLHCQGDHQDMAAQEHTPFLLSENNSQIAVPINKVCSIQLFFLKNRTQIESGIVTGRHDHNIKVKQDFSTKFI